jgi:hypothetical protein
MRNLTMTIKTQVGELLATPRAENAARCASITLCRQHTDLTCPTIAAIHNVADAEPSYSKAVVARGRREDPDFDHRYRQLLDRTRTLQRRAGYANAHLKRGLTTHPRPARTPPGSNYTSNGKVA